MSTKILCPVLTAVLFAWLGSCGSDSSPPLDEERVEYVYRVPEETGDGWATASLADVGIDEAGVFESFDVILNTHLYPRIHSVLIVKDGKLVLEEYYPGHNSNNRYILFDRETKHEVQSASKSVRSLLTGIAIDRGLIRSVDEGVFSFFPELESLNDAQKDRIKLRHVLTMSTGLEWHESDYPFGSSQNTLSQMYSLPNDEWAAYVLAQPAAEPPGTLFLYNTGASLLLNDIHSRVSGQRADLWADDVLYNRMESADVADRYPPLASGLLPRDMAKIGSVMLNGGRWKDTRIVSERWVQESTRPVFSFDERNGYASLWWRQTFVLPSGLEVDSFYASGNGGQFIFVFPGRDLVIVFTGGNFGSPLLNRPRELLADHLLTAILEAP